MAKLKTILLLGQSNMEGLAPWGEVNNTAFVRYFGEDKPLTLTNYRKVAHGINIWTPQLPFTIAPANSGGTTDGVGNTNILTNITSAPVTAGAYNDGTIFGVTGANAGIGRLISTNTATVVNHAAFPGAFGAGDAFILAAAGDVVAEAGSTTTVVNFSTGPNVTINRWIVCTAGVNVGFARFISASTTTSFTVDFPWPGTPGIGDVFRITTGGTQGADHDYLTAANPNFSYVGKFMPMQLNYQTSTTYTFTTGYDYSNIHGTPPMTPAKHLEFQWAGPMVEIMWQMRHEFEKDLWVILMPIPYSFLSQRGSIAGIGVIDFSWFREKRTNDWSPSSSDFHGTLESSVTPNPCFYDLYGLMIDYILKGKAKEWVDTNRPGDQLDVQGIFIALGESEALDYADTAGLGAVRAKAAGRNMRFLRDTMRRSIFDAGLTTLSAHRIPWVMSGMDTVGYPGGAIVNPQYQEMERDDPYTGYVETTGLQARGIDPLHFLGSEYEKIGQMHANKWREIRNREASSSTTADKRRTLEQLVTDVKRRYERNNAANDSPDKAIIAAINDASRDMYLELGDQAWFLRRVEDFTLDGSYAIQPSTLPRRVNRVLRVEMALLPGKSFPFSQVQRDQGQTQIIVPGLTAGTYRIHYHVAADDLEGLSDLTPIPDQYRELLVVLACRRLAENGGNATMIAVYSANAESLWKFVKRDCARYMRQTQNAITASADGYGPFADYEQGAGGY